MSNDKRAAIIRRIQALLNKTVANGATEDEALAALGKVEALLAEHDLTYDDVEAEVRSERYGTRRRTAGRVTKAGTVWDETTYLIDPVARLHGCEAWMSQRDGTPSIVFFGSESDTDLALRTHELLCAALSAGVREFADATGRQPRSIRRAFSIGFAVRVRERVEAILAERQAARETGGSRALVVLTKAVVVKEKLQQYRQQNNITLGTAKKPRVDHTKGDAITAGYVAGGDAALGDSAAIKGAA